MSDTISQVKTPEEHEKSGRQLVTSKQLVKLRTRLGFTRTAMAELLRLSPVTYYRCEDRPAIGDRIWKTTAERIGRFAFLAQIHLDELEHQNIPISELTPLHLVAVRTGRSQEVLARWYRNGIIHCEDLGILGLWVHDDDLHLISEAL